MAEVGPISNVPSAEISEREHSGRMQCTASLVLGIVALLLAWTPLLGLLAAIVGVILSVKGRQKVFTSHAHYSLGIGGLVLSIIAIVIGTLTTLLWAAALVGIGTDWFNMPDMMNMMNRPQG